MDRQVRTERAATPVRAASVLFLVGGILHLAGLPPVLLYLQENGELPVLLGERALGGGPFESLDPGVIALLGWAFVGLSALELLAARWLWQSRRAGGVLALVLSAAGAPFWIGFLLPYMLLVGPLRVALVALRWSSLR